MKNQVLVLGLDGCTFDLLNPWMEKGLLPNLKKLKEEGVSGILQSTHPPVTGPAWTSFMTGKNPGKHGIYEFLVRKQNSYKEMPVNADYMHGQTLWEILSNQGYKVGVLNVPLTYPPQKVNGVLISGFMTPGGSRDFIHPTELLDEIEEKFGKYYLHMRSLDIATVLSDTYIASFLQDCHSMMRYKFDVAHYLIQKESFDFLMLHIYSTDRIQHLLWHILDPQHPQHQPDLADKYHDEIVAFYRGVDKQIGEFIKRYNSSSTVFVISDHGFCKVSKSIDLNTWLLQEGYIKLKQGFSTRLRYSLWKMGFTYEWVCGRLGLRLGRLWGKIWESLWDKLLSLKLQNKLKNKFIKAPVDLLNNLGPDRKKLLLSLDDVDWSKTRAYCKSGLGQIFINVKGRDPEGIVNSGQEYETLKEEIIKKLRDFVNELTDGKGEPEIYGKEQIYKGDYFDEMPDITFLANKNGFQAGNLLDFGCNRTTTDITINTGHHSMDGILIARGEPLKRDARINRACLIDITPTILYLMGCKIPEDMDGKVLKEIVKEAFLEQHPVEFTEPGESKSEERSEMSPDEQRKV
ncbi:MAG: alkaline phosphatase family protein, partial [Deltaproteobacteria bacterium]|nr:alkaline phosphatase family protein [Deltaproteobacteria bacterium]